MARAHGDLDPILRTGRAAFNDRAASSDASRGSRQTAPGAEAPALLRVTRPIVLVGLMGAGKTCVGRLLARRLGLGFVDSDEEVAHACGCSVADIFRVYGEAAFRDGERKVMRRLLEREPLVLASGGGAFVDAQTRAVIRGRATSVWLKAGLDILVARTAGRPGRPLLEERDPRAVLAGLMAERYPIYGEADVVVETTNDAKDAVAERVLRALAAAAEGGLVL